MLDNNGIKRRLLNNVHNLFSGMQRKPIITVQRNYWREYGGNAPNEKTHKAWCEKFLATGSVKKESGGACTHTSEEKIGEIRAEFHRSPLISICQASR